MASSHGIRWFWHGAILSGIAAVSLLSAAEPSLELVSVTRDVPERGKLPAATMVQGKERNSFIVPAGWRLGLETKSGAVLLQSSEYAGMIEIRRMPLPENGADWKTLREQISEPAKPQEVREDYAWVGTPNRAQVFDTSETMGSFKLHRRVCFMLREDHVLVISLLAREQGFVSCLRAFEIVLASLRQEQPASP
ncbi:MAG: hypothetical protein N3J91_08240 [Verrucomicrobiae bacterium]|nr:hypothetical protein [Verrucomicrobiae bacterium]